MSEELTEQDWFENTFFYFIKALRLLELSAEEQCEWMGNYNVAWELQQDSPPSWRASWYPHSE